MANLSLTNNGMVEAVKHISGYCNHLLLLGGGGYDVQATARAWCRMWAAANRIDALPDYLLVLGGTFMRGESVAGADIVDMPYRISGEQKDAVHKELMRIAEYHKENTIPLIAKRLS